LIPARLSRITPSNETAWSSLVNEAGASQRMFENRLIDSLSKSHPVVNAVALYGVGIACLVLARDTIVTAPAMAVAIGLACWLAWTLAEYLIHRHAFHHEPTTPLGREIHRIMHGHHHDHPGDHERLMMPLGVSLPILAVIGFGVAWGFGGGMGLLVAGFLAIFFMNYDLIHFLSHRKGSPLPAGLRRRHMMHHFRDHDTNFGVSTVLWDVVFRTRRG
jgi:dihydroceramide fatty acyl 2-hydroxylase